MGLIVTHGFEFLSTVIGRRLRLTWLAMREKLARASAAVAVISAIMDPLSLI